MEKMIRDKRSYPRYDIELHGRYRPPGSVFYSFAMVMVNIAAEGLCFIAKMNLRPGSVVELEVELESRQMVLFRAEVIWTHRLEDSDEYRTGVKIVDANPEDQKKFIQFYCRKIWVIAGNGVPAHNFKKEKDDETNDLSRRR